MKRAGNLWAKMISFESLLRAHQKALRGKRFRRAVAGFEFNLEYELWRLHHQLSKKTYQPGGYSTFWVYEPKARLISAAPYRDRVVHHALTQALEPIFERSFPYDSYACRKGRGTHAAVRRAQHFLFTRSERRRGLPIGNQTRLSSVSDSPSVGEGERAPFYEVAWRVVEQQRDQRAFGEPQHQPAGEP
ncbi:MAG TPA: hypothetical protein VMV69_18165 [Pirellulales bacterium]|nr:hypothetical protein [Pirellulales bacterium]